MIFLILGFPLSRGDGPVRHMEACIGYVMRLVVADHALGEALDLVF